MTDNYNDLSPLSKAVIDLVQSEIDALKLDNANLLKDLKALTQSEQRLQAEKCELARQLDNSRKHCDAYAADFKALVHEQWDQGSKEYQELKKMWEKDGVKGFHSLIEWVEWLVKERDGLAVRLAHAQMDLEISVTLKDKIHTIIIWSYRNNIEADQVADKIIELLNETKETSSK